MNVLGSGHVPGSWGTCPAPFMESEVAARLGLGEAETQEPQSPRSPAPLGWGRPSPQAGTGVSEPEGLSGSCADGDIEA